ncbi:MAG TPA: YceI family protein [Gemmatimonadales bacterium]|nr:YceI family protein [Gemmatimonadales bacterium]
MKPLLLLALLQAAPAAPSPAPPAPTYKWSADPSHSAVGFRVRHLGIAWVNGTFRKWTAELSYDPANPENAAVIATIQAASIDTGNERRDNDLRSADYLATDTFPEITFVSREVERAGEGRLRITGDLTMRGVTRPVVLEADVGGILATARGRRTAFTATTTIKRQDFGVVFNRIVEGAQVVGDDVRITIDFEAVEQRQERPPEPKSSGGRP